MNRTVSSLVVSLLSFASASVVWGHSAVEPAPRGDDWWKQRQQLMNQRVAELGTKAEVIFIGDSITQGWEGEGKEVWAQYYTPRNAINLGIGGDRTQHVLWRLENGNLKGLKPKAAVVMIGTNNSNGEDNTVSQIADGVAAIVQKLRSTLPDTKILLLAIFPRGESPNAQRGKVLQVNQIIAKLADQKSVFSLDLGPQFVDSEGLIPRSLMPDFLHLSPAGYQVWAEALEPKLAEVLGGAPVKAEAKADLTGAWTFTTPGPDGQPVAFPMELKQSGTTLTGRFSRGGDRWLNLENGKVNGSEFSFTVKRDRPDGTSMTYQMSGKLNGNELSGKTKTDFEGNEMSNDWTAKRN